MKKIYITPAVSFDVIEDEDLMISTSTHLKDMNTPNFEVTNNDPAIIGDLNLFSENNTGGMSKPASGWDDDD
jgi:hypothetical protein